MLHVGIPEDTHVTKPNSMWTTFICLASSLLHMQLSYYTCAKSSNCQNRFTFCQKFQSSHVKKWRNNTCSNFIPLVIQDHKEEEDLTQSTISCWTSTWKKTADEEPLHALLQHFELLPTSIHECVLSGLEYPVTRDGQTPYAGNTVLMPPLHWRMLDWKDTVSEAPGVNWNNSQFSEVLKSYKGLSIQTRNSKFDVTFWKFR